MAVTPIATIRSWFLTNMVPTQIQFWAVFDSFRHKSEQVPTSDISGLNELFTPFNNHINDTNAHSALFAKTKIYAAGELQVFKIPGNENNAIAEPGDLCIGVVEGILIRGTYLGGDILLLASFSLIDSNEIPPV